MGTNYGVSEYPNTFKRQAAFPLDQSSKFNSYIEAEEYAANSPIAYDGQIISIVENGNVTVCFLQRSLKENINFELHNINDLTKTITNTTVNTSANLGTWSIIEKVEGLTVSLLWEILYPIQPETYRVYINDVAVSDELKIDEEFVTAPLVFEQENLNMHIAFYKKGTTNGVTHSKAICRVQANVIYKNDVAMLGTLNVIDSTELATLVENSYESGTLTLDKNYYIDSPITITKDLIINLNGYNIISNKSCIIVDNANLTINGEGLVKGGADYDGKIYTIQVGNGTATLNSGTYGMYLIQINGLGYGKTIQVEEIPPIFFPKK